LLDAARSRKGFLVRERTRGGPVAR
jgi:hypothetical protein